MLHIQKLPNTDIYAFNISDTIDAAGMEKFSQILDETKNTGKIKLLGELNEIPGFDDFQSFTETLKMKFKAMGAIGKYAIISNKEWIEDLIPIADFFTPGMPVKYFKSEDRALAIEWLKGED